MSDPPAFTRLPSIDQPGEADPPQDRPSPKPEPEIKQDESTEPIQCSDEATPDDKSSTSPGAVNRELVAEELTRLPHNLCTGDPSDPYTNHLDLTSSDFHGPQKTEQCDSDVESHSVEADRTNFQNEADDPSASSGELSDAFMTRNASDDFVQNHLHSVILPNLLLDEEHNDVEEVHSSEDSVLSEDAVNISNGYASPFMGQADAEIDANGDTLSKMAVRMEDNRDVRVCDKQSAAYESSEAAVPVSADPKQDEPGDKSRRKVWNFPCVFFLMESCQLGDECSFAHITLSPSPQPSPTYAQEKATVPLKKAEPCRYWSKGKCKRGAECNFSHVPLKQTPSLSTASLPVASPELVSISSDVQDDVQDVAQGDIRDRYMESADLRLRKAESPDARDVIEHDSRSDAGDWRLSHGLIVHDTVAPLVQDHFGGGSNVIRVDLPLSQATPQKNQDSESGDTPDRPFEERADLSAPLETPGCSSSLSRSVTNEGDVAHWSWESSRIPNLDAAAAVEKESPTHNGPLWTANVEEFPEDDDEGVQEPEKASEASYHTNPGAGDTRNAAHEQIFSPDAEICRYYLKGTCTFGERCKNLHREISPRIRISQPLARSPCAFFAMNRCLKGDQCTFSHDMAVSDQPRTMPVICKYWTNGTCVRGEFCSYLHADATPNPGHWPQIHLMPSGSDQTGGELGGPAAQRSPLEAGQDECVESQAPTLPAMTPGHAVGEDENALGVSGEASMPSVIPAGEEAYADGNSFSDVTGWLNEGQQDYSQPEAHGTEPRWSDYADPHADPSRPFCKFLAQGRCAQGDACTFRHALLPVEYTSLFGDPQPPLWSTYDQTLRERYVKPGVSSANVCKYFPLGKCRNGDACPYLHRPTTELHPPSSTSQMNDDDAEGRSDGPSERVCQYFASTGHCKFGNACHFSHDTLREQTNDSSNAEVDDNGWGLAAADAWHQSVAVDWGDQESSDQVRDPGQRPRVEVCFSFQKSGSCRYGDRCRYLHDRDGPTSRSPIGEVQTIDNDGVRCGSGGGWDTSENAQDDGMDASTSAGAEGQGSGLIDDDGWPADIRDAPTLWSTGDPIATPRDDRDEDYEQSAEGRQQPSPDEDKALCDGSLSGEPSTPGKSIHSAKPCEYFRGGHCGKGDACYSAHVSRSPASPEPVTDDGADEAEDIMAIERVMFQCAVHFGNDYKPLHVTTPSESNDVLLFNLAPTVTQNDIENIASTFGRVASITLRVENDLRVMVVEYDRIEDAIEAVTKLDRQTFDSQRIVAQLDTVAEEHVTSMLGPVKFKVTWPTATRVGWAMYPSVTTAKQAEKQLHGSTVMGRKIKASFHRPRRSQVDSFAIRLTGLPADIGKAELAQICPGHSIVTVEEPSYTGSPFNHIRRMVSSLGPLDSFDPVPFNPPRSKTLCIATFKAEPSLEGINALKAEKHSLIGNESISIESIYHTVHNLSERRYENVKEELDRIRSQYAEWCSIDCLTEREPVVIHIYGNVSPSSKFGRANLELQLMLQGEILKKDGETVWDEYFDTPSSAKALEKINDGAAFLIKVDTRMRRIHVVGTTANRERGRSAIFKLLKKVHAQRCIVDISRPVIRKMLNGGLKALEDDIGPNRVTIDVVAAKMTIRGDAGISAKVQAMIGAYDAVTAPTSQGSFRSLCTICQEDAIDKVRLPCRHVYCRPCLHHVLLACMAPSFKPPKCVHTSDGASCGTFIPYAVTRDTLRLIEDALLFRLSFLAYVNNHKDEYFFCPTPNCDMVYRATRDGVVYRCPQCHMRVCASCRQEDHEGLSCAEREEVRTLCMA